ncbi:MAG: gliding motility-associated C-terminal domain-containing protein [Bacteroidetes bacterium]|nr:gliding motility-associated C-terminal domain-containing protein [Bacteroidota bacterium]
MLKQLCTLFLLIICSSIFVVKAYGQACSLPGMTPDQAYPVCGTSVFHEDRVTNCSGPDIATSGCAIGVTSNSSIWYKFTCYQSGTLGFLISGIVSTDDYDWELFDITGHDPREVYTNGSLMVSMNLYGRTLTTTPSNSPTGCTAAGTKNVQCEGDANGNTPINKMPDIIVGHNYLLMVTNWTQSQAGYDLTFSGGTASITDPKEPHLLASRAICDGTQAVITTNKKMKCLSLAADGSDFAISPPVASVIAATGYGCTNGFDMDSIILTLNSPLPPGNYTISVKNGTDGNTLKDNCDRQVPVNESVPMVVYPVFPTPMDSMRQPACAPDELIIDFTTKLRYIRCNSIAADGSDFFVTKLSGIGGPVTVIGASGVCDSSGLTPVIKVKLAAPIQTKGDYSITLQQGTDFNTIINECGQPTAAGSTVFFSTKDTVNADFTYNVYLGCKRDSIDFFHDGRNEVNSWKWTFDNTRSSNLQNPRVVYNVYGQKTAQLIVSNGTCKDTSDIKIINLDNYFKADFEATAIVCPGDLASFKDTSTGRITAWYWDFGNGNTSFLQLPPQQTYPYSNTIRDVPVRLIVTDNLGCTDTVIHPIKVVGNCYIAVPNAFTPNGDGLNDYLYPLNAYKARNLLFRVYNRFGQLMFETTDWTNKWDGTFKGQGADPGTYVWILQYTNIDTGKRIEQKGSTVLIR